MTWDERKADELSAGHLHDCCDLKRGLLFPGGYGRTAALPRRFDAPARTDQSRQPRSRLSGPRLVAAGAGTAGGAETGHRLAAGLIGQWHGGPTHWARGTAQHPPRMT